MYRPSYTTARNLSNVIRHCVYRYCHFRVLCLQRRQTVNDHRRNNNKLPQLLKLWSSNVLVCCTTVRQRLRRSAVPEIWLCPPKFKWFTWLHHAALRDGLPVTTHGLAILLPTIYLPNLKSLSPLTTKIWMTIQNAENGVFWGS